MSCLFRIYLLCDPIRHLTQPLHPNPNSNLDPDPNVVSPGSGAIVHGATLEDDAVVESGAVILDGAVVGKGSQVGAGSLVLSGTHIPAGQVCLYPF